ncbi:MAG: acyl-CoA dehydrogenase family protein [Acidobacteriota bacterium]
MATEIDAARLLTQRAAWMKDNGLKTTLESSMAKLPCERGRSPRLQQRRSSVRRIWFRQGLSGREVLPRRNSARSEKEPPKFSGS